MTTVQIEQIHFFRDDRQGVDGAVYYLILSPCPGDPPGESCKHICLSHPGMKHEYERQLFRRGAFGYRLDGTPEEIANNRANVWGWDGNEASPTLTPSFLAAEGRSYRLHSFLTAGQLVLCGDSTVALCSSAIPCRDDLPAPDAKETA